MAYAPAARLTLVLAALACAALAAAAALRGPHSPGARERTLEGRTAAGVAVRVAVAGGRVESFRTGELLVRCASGYEFVARPLRGTHVDQSGTRFSASGSGRIAYPDGSTAFLERASLRSRLARGGPTVASMRYDVDLYAERPAPVDRCSTGTIGVALRRHG